LHVLPSLISTLIQDVPDDPEGLLIGVFQACIDAAIAECREKHMEPDTLGFIISSPLLDRGDIYVPFSPINENTVDALLFLFMGVANSKQQEGVTLWGEPFQIRVTALSKGSLEKRRIIGGAPRKLAPARHIIKDRHLIKVGVGGYKMQN
jgi:hypothetical protein